MAPDQEYDDAPISTSIKADALIDNTPPDVEEFLSEIGISDKAYTCSVKRIPLEGGSTPEFLPGVYRNTYPEINEIGEKYGPGTYFICFSWKASDGQKQKHGITISMSINAPPDVEEFLSEIGISDKAYTCSVKRIPLEGGSTPEFLPGVYRNTYPEINEIGEKYGPGTYFICFSWKASDGQKQKHGITIIRLGEEYQGKNPNGPRSRI